VTATDRYVNERARDAAGDQRLATQIDRDRILYCTSFARLAEVTQVVSADHGYVFHNRLTHSLKVAQLARRMAAKINQSQPDEVARAGGLDEDAAEAAGLAHDLGHPPFGHIAEEELNDIMREVARSESVKEEGFEGNAQSFRLVTQLSVGDASNATDKTRILRGLNLSRATLNGILKYPWLDSQASPKPGKKWGAYGSEQLWFDFARKGFEFGPTVKSLEAELMDWADDITYAVHDVVDFYCAGKIPLERFAEQNEVELSGFYNEVFSRPGNDKLKADPGAYKAAFARICKDVYRQSIKSRYTDTPEERSNLWHMATILITRFVKGIRVVSKPTQNNSLVEIDADCEQEIAMLKQLTWHYVILRTGLATVQVGQRRMVREVFKILYSACKNGNYKIFPGFFESLLRSAASPSEKIRLVGDCVSSMTEAEISIVYSKLTGHKVSPAL
jgi:dGTPase